MEVEVRANVWALGSKRGLPAVVGLLIALLLAPAAQPVAEAASLSQQKREAKRQLESIQGDMSDARGELKAIERRHAKATERLRVIEARIAKIKERIAQLEAELAEAKEQLAAAEQALADAEVELADTEEELEETRGALTAQQDVFRERVRGAFKQSNVNMVASVLNADDIGEAARAAHLAEELMARDAAQVEAFTSLASRVKGMVARLDELRELREAERQAAEEERDRIAGLVEEQRELKAQADAEADEQRSLMATLEQEEARYTKLVGSLQAKSAKLEKRIASIAAKERRIERQRQREAEERRRAEKRRKAAAASRSSGSSGGSGGSSSSSGMRRPVSGPITSGFGYRYHPIQKTRKLHAGIDFGAPTGTPIRAAASGRVRTARYLGGLGNAVEISHGGGKVTRYGHQSRLAVRAGQRVSRGQVIGYVGSTGNSTGPHLHFEVRINGRAVNPMRYL